MRSSFPSKFTTDTLYGTPRTEENSILWCARMKNPLLRPMNSTDRQGGRPGLPQNDSASPAKGARNPFAPAVLVDRRLRLQVIDGIGWKFIALIGEFILFKPYQDAIRIEGLVVAQKQIRQRCGIQAWQTIP